MLDSPPLPPAAAVRAHVAAALARYWPQHAERVAALPVAEVGGAEIHGPLKLTAVSLPNWAAECGVDGELLVPVEACAGGHEWAQVDWWLAAFLMLECWHERQWERQHGPVHSYSFRLHGWDTRAWDRAWVNRIGMFLCAWAAHEAGQAPDALPPAHLLMTHDVDAIGKTWPIRLKQGAFQLVNAARHAARARWGDAGRTLSRAARFVLGNEDWAPTFDALLAREQAAGVRARFHFYGGGTPRTLRRWLFDPAYDIGHATVRTLVARVSAAGGEIGLHQSFDAWDESARMQTEREAVRVASGAPVTACRQHWLRFGWDRTWAAQDRAGLTHDTTLMFNDRPGFRDAAALSWRPFNPCADDAHILTATPTVLMDSHLYDYGLMSVDERGAAVNHWLGEVAAVGGDAAVLWHPHTLTGDYGWSGGFDAVLDGMAGGNL